MRRLLTMAIIFILIAGCTQEQPKNTQPGIQQEVQAPLTKDVQKNTSLKQEILQIVPEEKDNESTGPIVTETPPEIKETKPTWRNRGIAISGKYADAEVIRMENDKYRMYYSAEPEVTGFKGQVYSAISSDGISWDQESGERMEWATFPSVIQLADGRYRMYFQNQGVIKSAISSDALSWKEESGTRMDAANDAGLKLENVAAPTVMKIGEEYVMVYRGTINEKYPAQVPNNNIQLFLWATSKDGLAFEKKGIALDSRNEEFQGLLDGPDLVAWDNETRLYLWSYRGVYHVEFSNGRFSEAEFDFTTAVDSKNMFPENPPSDPTIIKIGDKWFMYYGQHTKGIFYATLESEVRN